MTHNFVLRMASSLEKLAKAKTYVGLAKEISVANGIPDGEKDAVDRRKLRRIVKNDPELVLSMQEIDALDRFLEPRGEGLAFQPLLHRPRAVQELADAGHPVTFLLGARQVPPYNLDLSHWDVRGMTEILRGVNKYRPDVRLDIRDVPMHDGLMDARRVLTSRAWKEFTGPEGPSLVVTGSTRASHACELCFSIMLGQKFLDVDADKASLPFSFFWPATLPHLLPSAFRMNEAELEAFDPEAAREVFATQASALRVGNKVLVDNLNRTKKGYSYGICVSQRRPGGQVWLVVAGVTGPATLATARLVTDLTVKLPVDGRSVMVTAVRARVRATKAGLLGPMVEVVSQEAIESATWTPPK